MQANSFIRFVPLFQFITYDPTDIGQGQVLWANTICISVIPEKGIQSIILSPKIIFPIFRANCHKISTCGAIVISIQSDALSFRQIIHITYHTIPKRRQGVFHSHNFRRYRAYQRWPFLPRKGRYVLHNPFSAF